MSRTYFAKKVYKAKQGETYQSRERQSAETGVTILSTENQVDEFSRWTYTKHPLYSRHPSGTKGTGLRKWLKGKSRVADIRDRFGEEEAKSSRLRRDHRAFKHAARLEIKKELRQAKDELSEGKD